MLMINIFKMMYQLTILNDTDYIPNHIAHCPRIILFSHLYGYVSTDNVLMEIGSIVMNDVPGRM
jgi:hypothetical protein